MNAADKVYTAFISKGVASVDEVRLARAIRELTGVSAHTSVYAAKALDMSRFITVDQLKRSYRSGGEGHEVVTAAVSAVFNSNN